MRSKISSKKGNKSKKNHTLETFAAASFLNDTGADAVRPIWPAFVTSFLGAPVAFLGLLDGIGEMIASVSRMPSGYLSDKFKRKPFIWIGYLLGGIARIGYAMTILFLSLIPFHILDRLGKGLRDPPRDAMIAEIAKKKKRGRAFGVVRAADSAGATIGPLLALFIFPLIGFRNFILLAAIPSIIGAFLIYTLVKENTRNPKPFKKQKLNVYGFPKNLVRLILVSGLFAFSLFSISFMILYSSKLGLQIEHVAILFLLFSISASFVSIPIGKLSDRIGRKPVLLLGYLLFAIVNLGFIITAMYAINSLNYLSIFAMLSILFIMFGAHHGIVDTTQRAFVSDLAPKSIRGRALGTFQMVFGLAALPASTFAGLLWDFVSPLATFWYGFALSLIASLLFLIFVKNNV